MKKRSKQQKTRKGLIKISRWLFSIAILALFFYLTEKQELKVLKFENGPVLYSNACSDDLQKLFLNAIESTEHSCLLITYAFNDTKIASALNRKAEKGVAVKVVYDNSASSQIKKKLSKKIETQHIKLNGLMHKKVLIVDDEKIWIGSANMTLESLKLHDNLVIGLINQELAKAICSEQSLFYAQCSEQNLEYWSFPEKGSEGLERLIKLINEAKKTIRIAMFTWTHAELTASVIEAHRRGVRVEIVMDRGQASGVCEKTLLALMQAGLDVRLNSGLGLLHHKCAWIDETWLINGSANWTHAAFNRNSDCFLILHPLTSEQNAKLQRLWKKTKVLSRKPFDTEALRIAA